MAIVTQNQISLRYAASFPILLHYLPSALRSLSKNSTLNRFTLVWGRRNPNQFLQHIPYMYCRDFIPLNSTWKLWLSRASRIDRRPVVNSQVGFAKCSSTFSSVSAPIALIAVFNSPGIIHLSQQLELYKRCDVFTQCHAFLAQVTIRLFWKWVLLSSSILSGMPCCHKTCFLTPE